MDEQKRQQVIAKYGTDITRLNIRHVKQWVKALRSGKYKKTDGELANENDQFCALGVAAIESGLTAEDIMGDSCLPSSAMDWLGVDCDNPQLGPNEENSVSNLNDDKHSFSDIARRIETWWVKPYEKYKHCFLKEEK